MADRETVVKWIGVLLLKAADPSATEAERHSCQAKAEDLMRRYKIERAETERREGKPTIVDVVMQGCDYGSWKHLLAHSLSSVFETMWIFTKDKKFQMLVGQKEDVKNTLELFLFLATEICNLSLLHNELTDTYQKKDSFCMGCTVRVNERVKEFYAKIVQTLPKDCKALVLSKEGEIISFLNAKHGKTLAEQADRIGNEGLEKAFLLGYKAGAAVDIAGNRKLEEEAAHA